MKKLLVALLFTTTAFAQDITPEQVLDKYFDAIGGKANMSKVQDFYAVSTTEVMGQVVDNFETKKIPNKYIAVTEQAGAEMAKVIFDGTKANITQMGQTQTIEGDATKAIEIQALIFPETLYSNSGITLGLDPNEAVNGEDCYVITVDGVPGVTALKEFYSVNTGLKVKQTVESGMGAATTSYKDYKDYNGVKFSTISVIEVMGMSMEKKITNIKINEGVSDADFEIK